MKTSPYAASADFLILCPRDQKLVCGSDGAFLPFNPWTLTSTSVDFLSNGIAPGQIVQFSKPVSCFKPPGEILVVDSVAPNAITLRRKGQSAGVGQPPAPQAGLTSVEFLVATLGPQIALASYDIDRRYGINDLIVGRRTSDLYDPREVREATVLTVLYKQYLDMSRGFEGQPDTFTTKAQLIREELRELLDRVAVHWQPISEHGRPRISEHPIQHPDHTLTCNFIYNIYSNGGTGGPVDYSTPIATTASLSYVTGTLAAPSDNTFAVRCLDPSTNLEEANTDARVRIVIDANGLDVSSRPNPPDALVVRPTANGGCKVSWSYSSAGQGGLPSGFFVYLTPGAVANYANPAATVPFVPGRAGYTCNLTGLADQDELYGRCAFLQRRRDRNEHVGPRERCWQRDSSRRCGWAFNLNYLEYNN